MNKLDTDYLNLAKDILHTGVIKGDRTGTGTISVFGRNLRHNMKDGFPLLTTKKMSLKNIATELRWFLDGNTKLRFLIENGCNIWNGDKYKHYLLAEEKMPIKWLFSKAGHEPIENDNDYYRPYTISEFIDRIKSDDEFSDTWGDLGPIYGKQWRKWKVNDSTAVGHDGNHNIIGYEYIDQIAVLVNDLKTNPDSRRLMVSAWNVGDLKYMILPPCHYSFQMYTKEVKAINLTSGELASLSPEYAEVYAEKRKAIKNNDYVSASTCRQREIELVNKLPNFRKLSLMWNQRSVDTALGLPYNIASYGMLLTMLANEVGMIPDELICNLGDTHLYSNHVNGISEQLLRIDESYRLPFLKMIGGIDSILDGTDFELIDYKHHPPIKFPLSN